MQQKSPLVEPLTPRSALARAPFLDATSRSYSLPGSGPAPEPHPKAYVEVGGLAPGPSRAFGPALSDRREAGAAGAGGTSECSTSAPSSGLLRAHVPSSGGGLSSLAEGEGPCDSPARACLQLREPALMPVASLASEATWKSSLDAVVQLDCSQPDDCAFASLASPLSFDSSCWAADCRDSAMVIFDWDDTLMPTSALGALLPGFPDEKAPKPDMALTAVLRGHADVVEKVLRAARSVARVAIVTSSGEPWVEESARQYMPSLDLQALLRELSVQVYYAEEAPGGQEAPGGGCPGPVDHVVLKRDAMVRALTDLPPDGDQGTARLNAISVGDSAVEQRALKRLLASWGDSGMLAFRPLCKTVKLVEAPSLGQLGDELHRLSVWLGAMASWGSEFDLLIEEPAELTAKASSLFAPRRGPRRVS